MAAVTARSWCAGTTDLRLFLLIFPVMAEQKCLQTLNQLDLKARYQYDTRAQSASDARFSVDRSGAEMRELSAEQSGVSYHLFQNQNIKVLSREGRNDRKS